MTKTELMVGLVKPDTLEGEVTKEVLNHQGILFEEVTAGCSDKFPCVVVPTEDKAGMDLASEICESQEKVIIMEHKLPLDFLIELLSGSDKLYLNNKLLEPKINEYECLVLDKIRNIFFSSSLPLVRKWYWPNHSRACGIITHDIDMINYSPSFKSLRKSKIFMFLSYFFTRYLRKKPYGSNINRIIEMEKERNTQSTFYFLIDYGEYTNIIKEFLEKITAAGSEIGLHGSQFSFQDPSMLKYEKEQLESFINRSLVGIRQHILNLMIPETWRYQIEAGLKYDTSFSYNDAFGYRAGLCFPYHPFDRIHKKKLDIVEIPTSFMDWTALFKKMDFTQTSKIISKLKNITEKYNGCFVLNFHNSYLNREKSPDIFDIYVEILDYLKKERYWVATAKECYLWWAMRESAQVKLLFNKGKIIGNSSDNSIPLIIEREGMEDKRIVVNSGDFVIDLEDV